MVNICSLVQAYWEISQSRNLLFQLYDFDVKLRHLLILYCNKAEVQFKSALPNAVSIKTQDPPSILTDSIIRLQRVKRTVGNF